MAKRDSLVVVARGDGWALAWPRERWEGLTAEQQQDVIATQTAIMSHNGTPDRTRRPALVGRGDAISSAFTP